MLNMETKIIDRNNYEEIGVFKNAINPKTKNFENFRKIRNIGINKEDKIAMYCTGGIHVKMPQFS